MEESKTKPIRLIESELLQLQTGMIHAIEKTDSKWVRSPNATNVLYLKGANDSQVELNPDNSKTFPKSVLKTGSYGNGVQNSFSEPKFSLKGDLDFNESESWELRSKLNQKDFMSEDPLFKHVFSDWINVEGKGPEVLASYGDHEKSFFKINESVRARSDLFYLVINTRILNMRQSVFIFVCKKEEWQNFLDENLKEHKDDSKKNQRDKTSGF
jgi:hypothetical protein